MAGVIVASEAAAYWKLMEMRDMIRAEGGVIIDLLDQIIALFAAIKNEAGANSVEILAMDVYAKFYELHTILKNEPFNNPLDNDAIERIGLELIQLRENAVPQDELLEKILELEDQLTALNRVKEKNI